MPSAEDGLGSLGRWIGRRRGRGGIEASGRSHGRIRLTFAAPDDAFLHSWREQTRRLGVPALRDWKHELRCSDDGVGVDAETIDRRLGALGVAPGHVGQRGLFGRGLRDVWLA